MSFVLVDTSVFVNFFRGREVHAFKELLLNNQILLSHLVRLELLQGVRKNEIKHIEFVLEGLQLIPMQAALFEEAEKILLKVKNKGWQIGIVDLLLAAEANLMNASIYSEDNIFRKLADQELIIPFGPH